jgi:AcrR family transcriptional regulator
MTKTTKVPRPTARASKPPAVTPPGTTQLGKPKSGRPPGSSSAATRAKLLTAARKQFAEKGYAQTTFKDVGREAGITHAALYQYFDSKQALYLATLAETQTLLLPQYLAAIEQGASLRERIVGVLMASADAHDADSTITGFLAAIPIEIRRHPELADVLLDPNNQIMLALEQMFDEAKRSGEIVADFSSRHLVDAFLGGGVGVSLFHYGMPTSSLREAMEVFVALIEARVFTAKTATTDTAATDTANKR